MYSAKVYIYWNAVLHTKDNITPTQHCEAKSSLTHKDSGPEPTASRQPCIATPETAHQNLRRQNDK